MKYALIIFILLFSIISFFCADVKENTKLIDISTTRKSQNNVSHTEESNINSNESSENEIISSEVKNHVGDSLTIKGFVADVYLSEKVAYINFDKKFPKNTFSCAVFENRFSEFGDLSVFKNKNVIVSGKITTYKNKPQVILHSKDQIKILNEK